MGGGGSESSGKTEIRYAPYIETQHMGFLYKTAYYRDAALATNPFADFCTNIPLDEAFFGAGHIITSFPALYDMYGKFMAGLDIEVLFNQEFEASTSGPIINNLVAAKNVLLQDEIDDELTKYSVGMRDLNSVMASSFVIGKSIIRGEGVKKISDFDAELRYKMIPVAADRWKTHLDWNKSVVGVYAELMKLYYSAKMDIQEENSSMLAKKILWPFTVLEYNRAALGALQGATNTNASIAGASKASKAISGALSGAAMGAMAGGAIKGSAGGLPGMVIGAVLGLAGGLLS